MIKFERGEQKMFKKKEKKKRSFLSSFSICFIVVILAAVMTWIIPAGSYSMLEYNADSNTFIVSSADYSEADGTVLYEVTFDVYKNDAFIGQVNPSIQLDVMTQQQKLNASVISFPEEDLFVVYRGVNQNGDFSLDVRVNPFIMLVWVGFGMLMLGTLFALVGRRGGSRRVRG